MENNNAGGGVDNTFRRKFDPEEYLERAREREKQEAEGRGKSKSKGPPVQRKPLKHRDYEVDLDSRLGKTQFLVKWVSFDFLQIVLACAKVVTPIAPLSQQAGYYCSVCECVVKDSANYLDHINGKKRIPKSLGHVYAGGACISSTDFFSIGYRSKSDLKSSRNGENLEASQSKKEKAAEEEEPDIDPDIAAMMGFGGFVSLSQTAVFDAPPSNQVCPRKNTHSSA
ncbi:hypothetical protein DKX38_019247 [Salix brachista]|uniref:C2H2-type domain-containing protein n=1 Tax=Salix brachista TaxID=2182728 RepID=A0A5N5KFY0_9ROSI|nr:hypothetical protein DKX38_019247 [Salix brachista]